MTNKIYKSAMGKPVDMGSLLLQNENVRAVGNMGVNARGDVIDGGNRVIDRKNRQIQRQQRKTTTVSKGRPVSTGSVSAKRARAEKETFEKVMASEAVSDSFEELAVLEDVPESTETPAEHNETLLAGGLAAAIAKSREVKQEIEKTPRQLRQEQGLRKI